MKWITGIIIICSSLLLRCSLLGSSGDFAGGGVIGNPSAPTLSFADTIHCRVVTTSTGWLGPDGGPFSPITPFGPDSAHINQQQRYSLSGSTGAQHFRFSSPCGAQISSWSPDSAIEWTWVTAGICSVQVQQVEKADTSTWSEPLIVHIIE